MSVTHNSPRRFLRSAVPAQVVVFALAIATRFAVFLQHGGSRGVFGYDSGVYFAASDALIHGRAPYGDFVQLHPPMVDLVLTPITLLTKVISDDAAFACGILAFILLGSLNAVLTYRVAVRLGFGPAGAATAGAMYAVWYGAIEAEYLIKLEPLGNFFLLAGLLVALRAERAPHRWLLPALAGASLGSAISTKIWWVIPVLAVIVWHSVRVRSVRRAAVMAGGMVAGVTVVNLPFFVTAPRQMWHMVVLDQIGRPRRHSIYYRLADISTLARLRHLSRVESIAASAALVLVLLVVGVLAWRVIAARAALGLLALQLLMVIAAPSWYPYYCDFLSVALALAVGGAAASARVRQARASIARRGFAPFAMTATAVLTLAILLVGNIEVPAFKGGPQLTRALRHVRCVTADSPIALIQLDALSRGLADGCPNWVDITGPTFGRDRAPVPRTRNRKWQRDLLAYLRQGQAIITVTGSAAGITPALQREIARGGVLTRYGPHVVYRGTG